jgi:hypothetical protein
MQQPVAHDIGPHAAGCWQVPLMQSWPRGHWLHMPPAVPHATVVCCDGVTQKPRAQQPVQVPGPQAAITHAPLTHCSPMPHRMHVAPLAPHASGESPG